MIDPLPAFSTWNPNMLVDLREVAPGDLPLAVFEAFIVGNDYSTAMVEALRDHLVGGIETKVAVKTHGLNATKFKVRLDKLTEDIRRVGRINALLAIDQDRLDMAFKLATQLAQELDDLRSVPATPSA
ncbi:hypothetical protein NPS53_09180 [Pseudomonas putida]|nr:hypothetical protein [Pseudomonas putida]HDS1721672.1 hypothetical protein [Pseudomonas putida]